MTASEQILGELHGRLVAPHQREEFVPPPRFATTTFASYRVDPALPDQAAAVARVQAFATHRPRWWSWRRRAARPGLYLDGDFGVGKTHLLAAAWHAAPGTKVYCSFSEALSLAVRLGPERCVELMASDLVCIDEFELDDPSNTRLADLVVHGLVARGSRVLVTSNTVPGELGEGRLFVDQFRRQLTRVASLFADVHVPGTDYRRRSGAGRGPPRGWGPTASRPPPGERSVAISATRLDEHLSGIPVVSLRRLAAGLDGLLITDLEPWRDQLSALRFVHLVDRLYDWCVPLRVEATCAIDEVFLPEYRELGYAKKYRRCCSRLIELCRTGEEQA